MTTTTVTTRHAWVGCLACHNSGRVVGEWVDAIDAADVTPEAIHRLSTRHQELGVTNTEGLPVSPEMSPADAGAWGALLEEVDDWHREALAAR